VFLVQGVFMTSRLSNVPTAFSDLTAGLALFTMEVGGTSLLLHDSCFCFFAHCKRHHL
jgi:hypothetical protein